MERERVGVSIWKAVCDFEGTEEEKGKRE